MLWVEKIWPISEEPIFAEEGLDMLEDFFRLLDVGQGVVPCERDDMVDPRLACAGENADIFVSLGALALLRMFWPFEGY